MQRNGQCSTLKKTRISRKPIAYLRIIASVKDIFMRIHARFFQFQHSGCGASFRPPPIYESHQSECGYSCVKRTADAMIPAASTISITIAMMLDPTDTLRLKTVMQAAREVRIMPANICITSLYTRPINNYGLKRRTQAARTVVALLVS